MAIKYDKNTGLVNRELSWLSFNERVLQEAMDPSVPIIQRLRFLGIFSNNLDDFFRVRVATIKRMVSYGKKSGSIDPVKKPREILDDIHKTVIRLQAKFQETFDLLISELEGENIFLVNEKELTDQQEIYVRNFFQQKVSHHLVPIMLFQAKEFPFLRDKSVYFAIKLSHRDPDKKIRYALMELPTDLVGRFLVLPTGDDKNRIDIILLDDIIRLHLQDIFYIFEYDFIEAYMIKITRDAELDIDDDISKSFLEKVELSLKKRRTGAPVRLVYDDMIASDLFEYLSKRMKFSKSDNIIPGGRYHNFKDFIDFPDVGGKHLVNPRFLPLGHNHLLPKKSILNTVKHQDVIVHYPYQPFSHFINLLREAAIDPNVTAIKITLYRVAKNSHIINALINAAKNGKEVLVVVELQARFDENANIEWSNRLHDEGVKVYHGIPGLKIHSKLTLITRREYGKEQNYAYVGTGNFHEGTARIYSDCGLFTFDTRITREVAKLFEFFRNPYKRFTFRHLLVSPYNMRLQLIQFINDEIKNAQQGFPAYIILKANSLVDMEMVNKLYEASKAGVKIKLIIRGICSLVPGIKGLSDNIEAISIVDKFLEHKRIMIFANGGDEIFYIMSSDWMTRNLDYRIEIACPVYDNEIKKQLRDFIDIQLHDNVKARFLNHPLGNIYKRNDDPPVRAQDAFYEYLKNIVS